LLGNKIAALAWLASPSKEQQEYEEEFID